MRSSPSRSHAAETTASVVELPSERHLAVVPAGENGHVARPVFQKTRERIGIRAYDRLPPRRALGPTVERLDQGQELGELRAPGGRGVHHDLVAHERVALTQRERGVGGVSLASDAKTAKVFGP